MLNASVLGAVLSRHSNQYPRPPAFSFTSRKLSQKHTERQMVSMALLFTLATDLRIMSLFVTQRRSRNQGIQVSHPFSIAFYAELVNLIVTLP